MNPNETNENEPPTETIGTGTEPMVETPETATGATAEVGFGRATAGRRWSARIFDLWLHAGILGFAGGATGLIGDFGQPVSTTAFWLLTVPLAMAVEVVVYAVFGTTFGRWVFCTRVVDGTGKKVSPNAYGKRNLRVFLEGMAIGIPVVWIVAWLFQRHRVVRGRETSYDEKLGLTVRQYKQSFFKQLVAVAFVVLMVWMRMKGEEATKNMQYYAESVSIEYLQREAVSSPYASEALGLRYLNGIGVERDPVLAEKWFRPAARAGLETSWWNLALAISMQPGREADVEKPLRTAAEKGFAPAQYHYALFLSRDESRRNEVRDWLRKAAAQGLAEAKTALESLSGGGN